jgi:hypothetical protein
MMACCTISPLNSPQKRNSSGIFDLPKSAKRRRPFTTSNTTTTTSSSNINNNTTMYTTTSFTNNKPIIIDSKNDNSKSVFNSSVPYSPLDTFNNPSTSCGSGMEFKNELMERIKYEAKRLNKRRQMNLSCITTTSSIIPESTSTNNTSSSSGSSDDDDQENNTNNQPNKLKLLLNEMNNKKKLSSSSCSSSLNTSSSTKINNLNKNSDSTSSNIISNVNLTKTSDNINSTSQKSVNKKIDLLFNNSNYNDLPIFSMNQVNQICERMLKEREITLRDEYDKILSQKLNEQYDSFVRFTHEQIQRRFENSQCSYVS